MTTKRKRNNRKNKNFTMFFCIVAVIGLIMLNTHVSHARAQAYEYHDVGIWVVESGDTLWGIAEKHCDNSHDVRKVIDIIQDLNGGISANIQPGQVIDVPLFENMDWEYYEEN